MYMYVCMYVVVCMCVCVYVCVYVCMYTWNHRHVHLVLDVPSPVHHRVHLHYDWIHNKFKFLQLCHIGCGVVVVCPVKPIDLVLHCLFNLGFISFFKSFWWCTGCFHGHKHVILEPYFLTHLDCHYYAPTLGLLDPPSSTVSR